MSFDTSYLVKPSHICLNPFGTGQCLSTNIKFTKNLHLKSLNPFGTGQCLSTMCMVNMGGINIGSQSLWNRAMSFDVLTKGTDVNATLSQSLWNRAMSFDCSGVLEPCVARLPRATSQLFLMFE